MVQEVTIGGKKYPVIYNVFALMSAADSMGVGLQELNQLMQEDQMTEHKMFRILYAGLVAGAEVRKKRLNISFPEFLELVMFDEDAQEALGTLFQRQFELMLTKTMERADAKKKQATMESPSDTETSSLD